MKNGISIFFLLICGICCGQNQMNKKTFETICDSIYKDKGYKIVQQYFPDGIATNDNNNTVFQVFLTTKSDKKIIYQDTLYSRTGEIEFKDFNNDGVKDILIQNISDVRSNWTYYLFLVDTFNNRLKKVKGFEEIKNPNYLPNYDLIDNYVNSGQNWTSFYKIKNGSIIDYGIIIYDDQTEGGTYKNEYKQAIQVILEKEQTSR
jgi:hypothetical protein